MVSPGRRRKAHASPPPCGVRTRTCAIFLRSPHFFAESLTTEVGVDWHLSKKTASEQSRVMVSPGLSRQETWSLQALGLRLWATRDLVSPGLAQETLSPLTWHGTRDLVSGAGLGLQHWDLDSERERDLVSPGLAQETLPQSRRGSWSRERERESPLAGDARHLQ